MKFLIAFILFFSPLSAHKYNLAVCAIFKDCAPFLKEWIEFHRMLGVQHFYLYNNSSTDSPYDVLADYISSEVVTCFEWPNRGQKQWGKKPFAWVSTTQLPAYDHALKLARGKVKWMAFIDTDEFIVPVKHKDITTFLNHHLNVPGVKLYWQVYGTSHIYSIPENCLMIELLTLKCRPKREINEHTKLIVQPEKFANFHGGPHTGTFKEGLSPYVAEIEEARLNHYINRTIDFFYDHKIKGKETMDNTKWCQGSINNWQNLGNEVEDRIMDRFIPELRKRMGFK